MVGPILIFDSGVGGLSVAKALRHIYPKAAFCYACDNAWLPYGVRNDAELTERIVSVCLAAVAACQPCVLVVACNTASTLALEQLRAVLTIPVVGTVPAIKPAAAISQTRHIALLATSATVRRPYTQQLIDSFAQDCQITRVAADALVVEAERLLGGHAPNPTRINATLSPLWQAANAAQPMDTVVLGCTHFPLMLPWLKKLSPVTLNWVDSGAAIARRVGQVCGSFHTDAADNRSFTTASGSAFQAGLANYGFKTPQLLALDTGDS
ncbi:glutamate racemase [Halomonas sp. LS-001]